MSFKDKIKEIELALDLSKNSRGYIFKKWIFRTSLLLVFALIILTWGLEGFINPLEQKLYVCCPENGYYCDNPFYNNFELQKMFPDFPIMTDQVLPAGFIYGKKPSFLVNLAGFFSFCLFAGAFVVNHLVYNKKVKK